jgi:hypothetical protein
MSTKIIKSQFNDACVAGLHLSLESAAIFANRNKLVCLEVGRDGINIQPGPGGSLYLNTYNIQGPLYEQSAPPFDWLPNVPFLNQTPRKKFTLPIGAAFEVGVCVAAFGVVLGGMK